MNNRKVLVTLCLAILALAGVTDAEAHGWPCPELWQMYTAAMTEVSLYVLPDGSGDRLDDARLYGGARTDATITIALYDCSYNPIPGYPLEDLWLESLYDGAVFCPAGNVADHNTDALGQSTFSGALRGGGCGSTWNDEGLLAFANGQGFMQAALDIHVNSADRNGDLQVNLSDISLFAAAYYGTYDYCADFYWDGVLNLSDVALLAQANGVACD